MQRPFAALMALLLLITLFPISAFATSVSSTITAKIPSVRNVTTRHFGNGKIIILAPEKIHDGDIVEFTVMPDKGSKIFAIYCNKIDVTNKLVNNKYLFPFRKILNFTPYLCLRK